MPESSRIRAPGAAVPLTVSCAPQTAPVTGLRTGAVEGALVATVKLLVYSAARAVPARFFAAVVTRNV